MRITCETAIARPPEAVFPWIADPEKAMQWQKNVKSGEIIVSTPDMVGTTFTETVEEDGKALEMHGEITQYAENRVIAFRLESRIHHVDVSYSLEGSLGRTTVRVRADIRWKFPMSVVSLFLKGKMETELALRMDSELRDLKAMCESE